MPSIPILLLICIAAFFLGAIPFGFLAGKLQGKDIRTLGSGNIGATNAFRELGLKAGLTVFLLDAMKGFLPIFGATQAMPGLGDGWRVGIGLAAILGHIYSPFVRFKGGKGAATALGVLIALSPVVALITFLVFVVVVSLTRYVSLGSILGAVAEIAVFWLVIPSSSLFLKLFGTIAGLFVIVRHRANISRLLAGTESKVGQKKAASPPPVGGEEKVA